MPNNPIPQHEIDQAMTLVAECDGNVKAAAQKSGMGYGKFYKRVCRGKGADRKKTDIEQTPSEMWTEKTDSADFETKTTVPVRTLEQLYEVCKVDRAVWEVDTYSCTAWTTAMKMKETGPDGKERNKPHAEQNYRISAKFKRKFPRRLEMSIDSLLARIGKGAPTIKVPRSLLKTDPHMLEIGLHDVHFGKLAWAMETGENYDLKIAEFGLRNAVNEFLADTASINIEKIVVPIGQDFLHFDNLLNMAVPTTTAGTPQDVDGRWAKVFETAMAAMIWVAQTCLQRAPVHFFWLPGNHDFTNSFWLARVIQAHFRGCKNVTVDCSPKARKYIAYGPALIGFTHGNEEKHADLPTIMASEQANAWARATHREWHLGHFHKSKETRFGAGDTYGGVRVKILPSLSRVDGWHYRRGYVGNVPACEAYLWSKTRGFRGFFNSNAPANN